MGLLHLTLIITCIYRKVYLVYISVSERMYKKKTVSLTRVANSNLLCAEYLLIFGGELGLLLHVRLQNTAVILLSVLGWSNTTTTWGLRYGELATITMVKASNLRKEICTNLTF